MTITPTSKAGNAIAVVKPFRGPVIEDITGPR